MQAQRALKGLLWFIAVYQFVIGALLLLTPSFAQLAVTFYGATVTWTDQFAFILKPLGAYMLMTGVIAAGAARAPAPPLAVLHGLTVLFAVNALYRIVKFQFVQTTFGIATWHLVGQIVTLAGLGLAVFLLSRAVAKPAAA
jgi:hypothetical protein